MGCGSSIEVEKCNFEEGDKVHNTFYKLFHKIFKNNQMNQGKYRRPFCIHVNSLVIDKDLITYLITLVA